MVQRSVWVSQAWPPEIWVRSTHYSVYILACLTHTWHPVDAFNNLKSILFLDSAIAGEASGYAMGLVMLGTGHAESIEEMLSYSHETQHEKIIRGLAIGVAFICYGRQEEADPVVERLLTEKVRLFVTLHHSQP